MPRCSSAGGCGEAFEIEDINRITLKGKALAYLCPSCKNSATIKNEDVMNFLGTDENGLKKFRKKLEGKQGVSESESSESNNKSSESNKEVGIGTGNLDSNLSDIDLYKKYDRKGLDFAKKRALVEDLEQLPLKEGKIEQILYWWDRRDKYRNEPSALSYLLAESMGDKFAKGRIDDIVSDVFELEIKAIEQVKREKEEKQGEHLELRRKLASARGEELEGVPPDMRQWGQPEGHQESGVSSFDDIGKQVIQDYLNNALKGSKVQGGGGNPAEIMKLYLTIFGPTVNFLSVVAGCMSSQIDKATNQMVDQQRILNAQLARKMDLDPAVVLTTPDTTPLNKRIEDIKAEVLEKFGLGKSEEKKGSTKDIKDIMRERRKNKQ